LKIDKKLKEKINEEFLCVLRKNMTTNQVEIGYIRIENSFKNIIDSLSSLCDDPSKTLTDISNFIVATKELDLLSSNYRYCAKLRGAFQGFTADNQDTLKKITDHEQLMTLQKKMDPENFDRQKSVFDFKQKLKEEYTLWVKAYCINKAYRLCHEDSTILTFSHRIDGWSNPKYQLTPNFSVEIKTNFGYGRASYFYTKLKYKNIEITPFSEWIMYEYAKFSEIVRYTQSHILENTFWLEAMEYARDACNLSLSNEEKFVEKYIVDECEKMVTGLEHFFDKDHFSFKTREKVTYNVDKKGHVLIEFRGEKISGALDFITKIIELDHIIKISQYIKRIETCNTRILPILIEEEKIISGKLSKLISEREELRPKYDFVVKRNIEYTKSLADLQEKMISFGQFNKNLSDFDNINRELNKTRNDYEEFKLEFQNITRTHQILIESIKNYTELNQKVSSHIKKISSYFGK
jgi:hypothetical protein